MKKVLLFLFALLTTATVWAYEFTPLQMGENNGIELGPNDSDKGYLSFTPEVTDYYVISTTCAESHYMAFNLWRDSIYHADSKPDALLSTHTCHCGYPNKLYAGITYIMRLGLNGDFTTSVPAEVVIRPGHIVIPDPECAELSNVLRPLPVVAYEGQEVNLTVNSGVTISGLTATSGGQPVAMAVDESGTVYTFTMPAADVVISGSYEMPSLQLGDNEIDLNYEGTQYAFVPEESGAYVFSMNCGAEAQVRITENNDYIGIGYAATGETVKVGAMLKANTTYYVVPAANAEDVIEGVIFNIAKLELPPITVGENVIDVSYGNFFDYSFTPTESGDYRFYTTGDAEIRPHLEIYLGENMIGQCYHGNSDLDLTVSLEAGVTYTVKAAASPDMPVMSVMHLNVTNEGGSSGGDDNIVLQMGDNGPFNITNDGVYLSFTPEATDYYVFSTFATAEHVIAMSGGENLFFESAYSEAAPFGGLHAAVYGIPEKLNAGVTYTIIINALFGSGQTYVRVDKGYLVRPDAESAYLANVLTPLPTVAYEGQEVKLTNQNGATINNLTATANGEPVEVTIDGTGMVYTFTMPAADVVISGSCDMPSLLQMGDNEVALAEEATVYTFTPTESGAYLLTMNCNASAAVGIIDNEEGILSSMGSAEVPGQTICAAAMLEAGVTYQVVTRLSEGSINSAILNIAKYELAPITLGENEIYSPFGTIFEYPFTPPVSGEYTFRTIGDASFSPSVAVFLGEDVLGYDLANNEDAEFTATLEAGVTYTVRTQVRFCYNTSLIHLTVVSPLLAINVPESFEHGTVTCDKVAASIGETVTLTVTPNEGYELENLTVTFTNEDEPSGAPLRLRGGPVELTSGENGTYTFEMPAAPVTVNATFKESTVTGVEDINVATTKRGQRYNIIGQPVGKDYKGIVIENGKKRVIK